MHSFRHLAPRSRGFVLITVVASTVVLMACIGMTIDAGYLQMIKSRMQTAADAAAVGAVQERKQNGSAHLVDAAKADAALNGFTDGQHSVVITVNTPPASGYYTADATAVEVLISQSVGTLFMSVIGFTSINVSARSVARQGSGSNCIYALDPAASGAFTIQGGATSPSAAESWSSPPMPVRSSPMEARTSPPLPSTWRVAINPAVESW